MDQTLLQKYYRQNQEQSEEPHLFDKLPCVDYFEGFIPE